MNWQFQRAIRVCRFPVAIFCKENDIEYSWDFNREGEWTEILDDEGKLILQIGSNATVNQFKNVLKILSEDPKAKDFPDPDDEQGEDYFIAFKNRKKVLNFLEKHKNLLT